MAEQAATAPPAPPAAGAAPAESGDDAVASKHHALVRACVEGRALAAVQECLAALGGASAVNTLLQIPDDVTRPRATALHLACVGGNANVVEWLVQECGADLAAQDEEAPEEGEGGPPREQQ